MVNMFSLKCYHEVMKMSLPTVFMEFEKRIQQRPSNFVIILSDPTKKEENIFNNFGEIQGVLECGDISKCFENS